RRGALRGLHPDRPRSDLARPLELPAHSPAASPLDLDRVQGRAEGDMRVAVVGAGRIAEQHFRALARVPGVEVAVCDRSPVTAEFAAERFGLARHATDFAELLRDWRPEVVHVTTPVGAHVPLALASLAAGAHVLVEKPIAPSYSEWLELRAAAE